MRFVAPHTFVAKVKSSRSYLSCCPSVCLYVCLSLCTLARELKENYFEAFIYKLSYKPGINLILQPAGVSWQKWTLVLFLPVVRGLCLSAQVLYRWFVSK